MTAAEEKARTGEQALPALARQAKNVVIAMPGLGIRLRALGLKGRLRV